MKRLFELLMTSLVIVSADGIEILDITPFQIVDVGDDVELLCDLGLETFDDSYDWEVTWFKGFDIGDDGDIETAATAFISTDAIGQIGLIGDGYKASLSAGQSKNVLRWSLTLENANIDDTGVYQCKVSIMVLKAGNTINSGIKCTFLKREAIYTFNMSFLIPV